jgi:hypothetical protein
LTKLPESKLLTANVILNVAFALRTPLFVGNTNLAEGMLSVDGMRPIGAGLHDPVLICLPLVIGTPGAVRQKLMKLFVEVSDGTWPGVGWSWPSSAKPAATTLGSSVKEVCGSILPASWGLAGFPVLLLDVAGGFFRVDVSSEHMRLRLARLAHLILTAALRRKGTGTRRWGRC